MNKEELESICETLYRHLVLEERCYGNLTKQTEDTLKVLMALKEVQQENEQLKRAVKKLLEGKELGTGLLNTLYSYGIFDDLLIGRR